MIVNYQENYLYENVINSIKETKVVSRLMECNVIVVNMIYF